MAARLGGALVLAGAAVVLVLLLVVATSSPVLGIALCGVLAGLVWLAMFGLERSAVVAFTLAFATAPAYRGLEQYTGDVAPPTDLLLLLTVLLLLPVVISRTLNAPASFVLGLVLVMSSGLVASLISGEPELSVFTLIRWLFFLGVVPILVAWWRPDTTTIALLLWAYVIGQVLSTAYALFTGPVVGNRYQGLSHHTNAFGMAGLTAIAILLYLFHRHRSTHVRAVVLAAAAVSLASIIMSGSRAALVVAAVLLLMIPVVERSAVSGFVGAILGALALIAFPLVVSSGHGGSALTRLAGQGTAGSADQARTVGFEEGLRRFGESPILGSGLVNVEIFHNVYLEVLVGVGIFGLFGYLMILFTLTRPLISGDAHRRLGYLPLAFVGMAPALPGIWDETMWVPIALSILPTLKAGPVEHVDEIASSPDVVGAGPRRSSASGVPT